MTAQTSASSFGTGARAPALMLAAAVGAAVTASVALAWSSADAGLGRSFASAFEQQRFKVANAAGGDASVQLDPSLLHLSRLDQKLAAQPAIHEIVGDATGLGGVQLGDRISFSRPGGHASSYLVVDVRPLDDGDHDARLVMVTAKTVDDNGAAATVRFLVELTPSDATQHVHPLKPKAL